MNIPPKYEDVVAQLEAAMGREAALQEDLSKLADDYCEKVDDILDLQQRLSVAERRESEAREEILELSRKLDVFYSRSHGIKNLSAIECANDKSKALQQRLTLAEQRAGELLIMLRMAWGSDHVSAEDCRRIDAALQPAEEGEGS